MLVLLPALPGCILPLDEDRSSVGELVRDCVVPLPEGVRSLGAPVSIETADGSFWILDVELADGRLVSNATARVDDAEQVCTRGLSLSMDGGLPAALLAPTERERGEDAERSDGRQLRLVPLGGFVARGEAHLFYAHVLAEPGALDGEHLGTGICIVDDAAGTCERLSVDGETVLFDPHALPLDAGGLVTSDRALVYGCREVAALSSVCTVFGAPLDHTRDPSAYQAWSAFEGWGVAADRASSIVDELGRVTVSAIGDGYRMTILDVFEGRVYVRGASSPTGAFGRRLGLFDVVPSPDGFPGGGREHASLRHDERELHLSYSSTDPERGGLHLASFRFYDTFFEDTLR